MKKIGLYFGTFNPIHVGHLIIGQHFVETSDLDEVWFVVSPHNPLKNKKGLLDDHHRLAMVREAIYDNPKLEVSNIEFDLPKPSYTSYTLGVLKEKHPDKEFALIMGEDNLRTFHKWKNYDYILENYSIFVYPRVYTVQELADNEVEKNQFVDHANVHFNSAAPIMKVSSSHIRKSIKEGVDVKYLLTAPVYDYLTSHNFYK